MLDLVLYIYIAVAIVRVCMLMSVECKKGMNVMIAFVGNANAISCKCNWSCDQLADATETTLEKSEEDGTLSLATRQLTPRV